MTDKHGHHDCNGSRWFGNQVAKVAYRVLVEGRDWEPLHLLWIDHDRRSIRIGFHVTAPQLRFAAPWIGNAARPVPHHGFCVDDDAGAVPIANVALAGRAIVHIALARDVREQAHVWLAHEGVGGNGTLRDSDNFVPARPLCRSSWDVFRRSDRAAAGAALPVGELVHRLLAAGRFPRPRAHV